jgi:pyruvate ferredoxin oxidoreductase alpha subunit
MISTAIGKKTRDLGIVQFNSKDILTVATVKTEGFWKYYLGKAGTKRIDSFIGKSGMSKLNPGWEQARFAFVTHEELDSPLGIVAEYPDGSFVLIETNPIYGNIKNKANYIRLTKEYILAESRIPASGRLKTWEEIASGAAIKEAFTSRKNNTGLWGQMVPVVSSECNDCLKCYIQCPDESIFRNPITGMAELIDPTKCKACGVCEEVCNRDAITMVDKKEVKAAQENVFTGIFGKRLEVNGPVVKKEFEEIKALSPDKSKAMGYSILYECHSDKKSLSGQKIMQVSCSKDEKGNEQHPTLYTYLQEGDREWKKIIRPLTHILIYGFTDEELELASRIQLEGFFISAIPSAVEGFNSMRDKFIGAGYTSNETLEGEIKESGSKYDAVITAYYENIQPEIYLDIMDQIGVFLAPFMKNFSRDQDLDEIIHDVQTRLLGDVNGFQDDDRTLAKVLNQEKDIAAGHRACAGCPIDSTFNLAMQSVREVYDTADEKIEIVNSGATGCSEVVTTVFPDTSWKKFLHTTFGALGANLEGMNAAYRFLRKTNKIEKRFKFFGWAGDGGTYDIGLQALSGFLERGLATDSIYLCYDNGAYMNTGVQRSSATPMGAGTSTTPIGDIVRGKSQFRKNLAEFAAAHQGVYVATVSIAIEMDFKRKLQKAAKHDGPALIIAFSNCTTGHGTGMHLTVEQSRLAVESGYWPLFEFENGEKRITYEPNFIRKYETAKQNIKLELATGEKEKQEFLSDLENIKTEFQDKFTENLAIWLRSEGRFALHFDKEGNIKNAESVTLLLQLFEELKIEWNKLGVANRNQIRKEKLISVLVEYLREEDEEIRQAKLNDGNAPFGINAGNVALKTFVENQSDFDLLGKNVKETGSGLFANISRQMDAEAYFDIYGVELKEYDPAKPELTDELRDLGKSLRKNYYEEQVNTEAIQKKALDAERNHLRMIQERIKTAHSITFEHSMDESEKQKNRAVLGAQHKASRIFARAGDGGVTTAKLFASLLGQIGIFGKAAPDYGPERRGAPVGTNIQFGGRELRTQASYEELDISIVKDPGDQGWSEKQWRDAVKSGGKLIVNTKLNPGECRKKYRISRDISVYTFDATRLMKEYRVPETVTLMGVALRTLVDIGISIPKEYLNERLGALLDKQFAAKAGREKIVKNNKLALWEAFENARSDKQKEDKTTTKSLQAKGFEKRPPEKLMTGSESVAEAWRQINPGVFAMFPITPSTEVGQEFSKFWADGKVDTEYIHTESEHSSFMTIIAAAACGVRAVTSTASQGMLLGKEGGLLAASLRLPLVVNVGTRETNAPLSIHAGHTDAYQFRDDGWIQLFARNAQEAYDFALIGQKIAEKARLPVFLNQDGFIVTHTKDMLDTISDEEVKAFVGDYTPEDSLLTKDMTLNPISLQDYYSEHVKHAHDAQAHVPKMVEAAMAEFGKLTGRKYGRVTEYKMEAPDVAIVCMGSTEGTTMDAVDKLREDGKKVGLVSIKNFRPFPIEEIKKALLKAKTIIVMDRMGSLGTEMTPLGTEIKAAIKRDILNLEYGRGGRNTPQEIVEEIFNIGFNLGWEGMESMDRKKLERFFNEDEVLSSLFTELEEVKGDEFVRSFKELIIKGKFIDAFGPKEHIDVREKSRQRDIKLSIIERVVMLMDPLKKI